MHVTPVHKLQIISVICRAAQGGYGEKDNAKLYRLIEQQLLDSQLEIDFEQLWVKFQQADRELRGTLSANQVCWICTAKWHKFYTNINT